MEVDFRLAQHLVLGVGFTKDHRLLFDIMEYAQDQRGEEQEQNNLQYKAEVNLCYKPDSPHDKLHRENLNS